MSSMTSAPPLLYITSGRPPSAGDTEPLRFSGNPHDDRAKPAYFWFPSTHGSLAFSAKIYYTMDTLKHNNSQEGVKT